jgi:hypothetical protein
MIQSSQTVVARNARQEALQCRLPWKDVVSHPFIFACVAQCSRTRITALVELLLDLKFSNLLRNQSTPYVGPELRHRISGDILIRCVYRQLICSARPSSNFSNRALQRFKGQWIWNKIGWQGMDWVRLSQDRDQLSGSCDHGNEPPGSTKDGECEIISGTSPGPLFSRQHPDSHMWHYRMPSLSEQAPAVRSGSRGIIGSISTANLKIRELSTLRFPPSIRVHVVAGIVV